VLVNLLGIDAIKLREEEWHMPDIDGYVCLLYLRIFELMYNDIRLSINHIKLKRIVLKQDKLVSSAI
jgi:hypothetical protein